MALALARAGKRVAVFDRATFPRHKVCGDCLNPSAWPVLRGLGAEGAVRGRPHVRLEAVDFAVLGGWRATVPLPGGEAGEIAIERAEMDDALLGMARKAGAEVFEGCTVRAVRPGWQVETERGTFTARNLVAADGRNSSVLRGLGLLPKGRADRVAIQAHIAAPHGFGARVALILRPEGYCGLAALPGGRMNVCLVARARDLQGIRAWAEREFAGAAAADWRTITPLSRGAVDRVPEGLWAVGDAARVVEPFTGEGIYYAVASGALAGRAIVEGWSAGRYRAEHRGLYRGRLWVNRLARLAVLHPGVASAVLRALGPEPAVLRALTAKVAGGHSR